MNFIAFTKRLDRLSEWRRQKFSETRCASFEGEGAGLLHTNVADTQKFVERHSM